MLDVSKVKEEALKEVQEEKFGKAKKMLKKKFREIHDAEQILVNLKREAADLEASIADGTAFE